MYVCVCVCKTILLKNGYIFFHHSASLVFSITDLRLHQLKILQHYRGWGKLYFCSQECHGLDPNASKIVENPVMTFFGMFYISCVILFFFFVNWGLLEILVSLMEIILRAGSHSWNLLYEVFPFNMGNMGDGRSNEIHVHKYMTSISLGNSSEWQFLCSWQDCQRA